MVIQKYLRMSEVIHSSNKSDVFFNDLFFFLFVRTFRVTIKFQYHE